MRSRTADRTRAVLILRSGLLVLSLSPAVIGFWALLGSRSFFAEFPGLGRRWVAVLGPFNEHLTTDVGGLYLGLAIVLVGAAISLERTFVLVVLLAILVQATAHLAWHLGNLEPYGAGDRVGNTIGLGLPVVLSAALLMLAVRRPRVARADDPRGRPDG